MNSINSATVRSWITKIVQQLRLQLDDSLKDCLMIGIHTGGVSVAKILHQDLRLSEPLGELNISFYRDDFSRSGLHPKVGPSNLPVAVDNQTIILVDDVIHSGRTIRAAMNEIFDFGRPARIILVALVEREGRELPIRADIIGQAVDLQACEHIKLQNHDMSFVITDDSEKKGKAE